MAEQTPQKQIADKLKDAESILVTVNTNPTVDELSAALGFTLLLNKMKKHATAVFSGAIPPAITFLEPEKTFEGTVNSLRDFIIALDKEKADHLRYKVDGDMVKIFITPYRTTISQDDLEFSQGDYNVEMVVAIGVRDEADLDRALSDHGKIMHDATVASLSVGSESSELGTINWHENDASSYSEMLVSIAESLRDSKNLIDEQIATAFLTGIVAATERFSNNQTTSKAMTIAAQLMAAGANQQLIATQLEDAEELPERERAPVAQQPTQQAAPAPTQKPKDVQAADGTMQISHEMSGDLDEVAAQTERQHQDAATRRAAEALEQQTSGHKYLHGNPILDDSHDDDFNDMNDDSSDAAAPAAGPDMSLPTPGQQYEQFEPSMGGTLNATAQEAADARIREEIADRHRQILSHDHSTQYVGNPPADLPAVNSFNDTSDAPQPTSIMEASQPLPETSTTAHAPTVEPLSYEQTPPHLKPLTTPPPVQPEQPESLIQPPMPEPAPMPEPELPPAPYAATPPVVGPTLAELDAQNRQPHEEARSAIDDAFRNGPSTEDQQATVENTPPAPPELPLVPSGAQDGDLPPLPPMPDFSTLPPLPGGESEGPQAPPLPPQDPTFAPPSGSTEGLDEALPPIPPTPGDLNLPPDQSSDNSDPNQFQIPGQ